MSAGSAFKSPIRVILSYFDVETSRSLPIFYKWRDYLRICRIIKIGQKSLFFFLDLIQWRTVLLSFENQLVFLVILADKYKYSTTISISVKSKRFRIIMNLQLSVREEWIKFLSGVSRTWLSLSELRFTDVCKLIFCCWRQLNFSKNTETFSAKTFIPF